jgi:type VI secretion system secreted protein Hcp
VPIYLKIDGVEGTVTEDSHKNWIELESFQWGVGRGISTPVGRASDREASMPSISEIVVSKIMDKASINIFDLSLSDAKGKKYEIDFVKTATSAGGKNETFLHYELENCLISAYSLSSGASSAPAETISLNFTKITEKYVDYGPTNADGKGVTKGYDVGAAKTI